MNKSSLVVGLVLFTAFCNAWAARSYLDDANKTTPSGGGLPSINHHQFPRVLLHKLPYGEPASVLSKYQFIDAAGEAYKHVESVQSNYSPETMTLRHVNARSYNGFTTKPCYVTTSPAFESTGPVSQGGPATAGCSIYAGHWLYQAGTKLTQSVNASSLQLKVADASKVQAGQYVVIYNAPAGSFNNAEHVKVKSRDLSTNTITLQARGYKSKAASHASGSIVAQHVLGQGVQGQSDPRLWAYNLSSQCPKDGNNKTFGEFFADWLQKNLLKTKDGVKTTADVAGVLFDSDFYFELATRKVDANNDLVQDDGMGNNGINWLGRGLDIFYQRVRNRLPNYHILAGVHDGRGYDYVNGVQLENWLDYGNGDFEGDPEYKQINSLIARYWFNMSERSTGTPLVHNLTKTATKLYPGVASPKPTSNAPFRLGLALTLMENGYFGTHSRYTPDAWWDEYAVDVTPGSANYGNAIDKNDVSSVHNHRGWMGRPLGRFTRIYDDTTFAPSKSMIYDGSFDGSIGLWTSKNVNISRVTSGQFEGSGALRASTMNTYAAGTYGAKVQSEKINLVSGVEYTVAFAAKASLQREIDVEFGGGIKAHRIPLGNNWRRYVISFTATKSETTPLKFNVGRENSQVWLDSVYVFKGGTNVFRRDFENGIALANASSKSKTINLGGPFQKIMGTQDSLINNGATVSSVTLKPYDGILLVRPDGDSTPPPPVVPPSGNDSGSIGDLVWNDADGDGIQDTNESGLGGVTVQLRSCQGTVLKSLDTGSNGAYSFAGLAVGNYQLRFIAPSGAKISPQRQGSSTGLDSNPDPATGLSKCLPISEGQARKGIDAGIVSGSTSGTKTNRIGDFVWRDTDGDGIQDTNESGLGGVTVQLRNCQGTILDTVVTANNGAYQFSNMPVGDYQLKFKAPAGTTISPSRRGTLRSLDSNPDPTTGLTRCASMSADRVRIWIDAGIIP